MKEGLMPTEAAIKNEAVNLYLALVRIQHTLEYVHPDDAKFVANVLNRVEGKPEQ